MARKLRVTIDLEVEDISDEQRVNLAEDSEMEPEDFPKLVDIPPMGLGTLIAEALQFKEVNKEIFDGTSIFANFTSAVVVSAKWESQ